MARFKPGDQVFLAREHREKGRYGMDGKFFRDRTLFVVINASASAYRDEPCYSLARGGPEGPLYVVYDSMLDPFHVNFPGGVRYRVQFGPRSFIQSFDGSFSTERLIQEAIGQRKVVDFKVRSGIIAGNTAENSFTLMRMD